jgi:glucose/arabinose dehydrogenase
MHNAKVKSKNSKVLLKIMTKITLQISGANHCIFAYSVKILIMSEKSILLSLFLLLLQIPKANSQPHIKLTQFATGLQHPVDIKNAGDSRLFVIEQPGIIRIVDSTGNVKSAPFLNITNKVFISGSEQGLLGLAFHPSYKNNGYFYVDYTGAGDSIHISRFSVSPVNPDSAFASSEFRILTIYKPFINHNGGDLNFGPDGYMYIGTGDGGGAGDPGNRAQDSLQLLGKMLRIDVDHSNPYSVPESNPFKNNPDALGEIWALGLRNPWRFSFDPLTGDLWIADVGQSKYEEIDFQPALSSGGENYGWRCFEGDTIYNAAGCKSSGYYTFPVFVYPHNPAVLCNSVTGGCMYRGSKFINLYGLYFFADYCTDDIWSLKNSSGTWLPVHQGQFPGNNFSTFGMDVNGEIYAAGRTSGIIFKIADSVTGMDNIHDPVINLYPNPFTDHFIIELQKKPSSNTTLSIFDLQGRNMYYRRIFNQIVDLNLYYLAQGIYILHMEIEGKHIYRKIIRE